MKYYVENRRGLGSVCIIVLPCGLCSGQEGWHGEEYAGAHYHVMARGNRREDIFLDDEDRRFFLKALSEVCGQTGWRVHAWMLMSNHYHLFIETPEANHRGWDEGAAEHLHKALQCPHRCGA